jgi:hypothetical protein
MNLTSLLFRCRRGTAVRIMRGGDRGQTALNGAHLPACVGFG